MRSLLVVGLGEVGSAIYSIAKESEAFSVYGYDIDPSRSVDALEEVPVPIDYLHFCVPYTSEEAFLKALETYVSKLSPRLVIVHSTVAPGTTRAAWAKLRVPIAYTPVRGKHPHLKDHILFWTKWVAALPTEALSEAAQHLKELGLRVREYTGSPETLELAKLVETVYRALMIAWWQEVHRMARAFGADLSVIAEFVGEVHEVLRDRPVLYPGVIGGHCLIPNTMILRSKYASKMLDAILESNERRQAEIDDPSVKSDIERVKAIAARYLNKDYFGESLP